MATKTEKTIRVGLLVATSLTVLALFVFFIGAEQKIFARKNEYDVHLENVSGLAQGNPVQMAGVTIGVIKDITLPQDPKERNVKIALMIDRKYEDRVRGDSRARLKRLGLLTGDSYIDITPGTPRFPVLEPGSLIPAQKQTNVDQLISSGEDLVDNLVQISYSMKNILGRVDRGEGLLGELTSAPETRQRLTDTLLATLNKTNAALAHIESGKGVMGRLIYDDAYGERLTASLAASAASMQAVAGSVQRSFETGDGALPALLSDPEGKRRMNELMENLRLTSANLATFSTSISEGQGLLPRLMNDKQYGDQALAEFTLLISQLNETVRKINSGEGTAGKLVADPSLYEAVNDILIGINESRLLRWLIRNRQQEGIDQRYDEQRRATPPPPAPEVTGTVTPSDTVEPPVVPPTTTVETTPNP
ncbi:MAG TPA: MlaD family protein [Thermoanaerobaculia bacterium]|nr:MlaD family protein [Thermoanaerobaculia bacterium]